MVTLMWKMFYIWIRLSTANSFITGQEIRKSPRYPECWGALAHLWDENHVSFEILQRAVFPISAKRIISHTCLALIVYLRWKNLDFWAYFGKYFENVYFMLIIEICYLFNIN